MHLALKVLVVGLTSAIAMPAATISWQETAFSYTGANRQKFSINGQSARLIVPENPAKPDGAKVDLAVFRLPNIGTSSSTPIVYLHGGPGGASMEHLESAD